MCDHELLVAYLYGELGDADRARIDAHLRGCGACRTELAGLRGVRATLTAWAPPEPDLGFQIVRARTGSRVPGWRARFTPALGVAAAATLILAAAAAVANVQVHYAADGFTVRTGWARSVATTAQNVPAIQSAAAAPDPVAMQAIERRIADLEQLEKSAQAPSARQTSVAAASVNRMSDAELRKFVRELVAQSETREQTMLARQIQQVTIDTDRKRATDMGRVLQMVNYIDSRTASDAQQHLQLANMIRVANQK